MTLWNIVIVVALLTSWLCSVSCEDLPHNWITTPQTSLSDKLYAGQPTDRLNPYEYAKAYIRKPQPPNHTASLSNNDVEDHETQGVSSTNGAETPYHQRDDEDRRLLGGSGSNNLPGSGANDHIHIPGGGPEDHRAQGATGEDLCHSLCLCKRNDDSIVSCEHEHVDDDHIHNLTLSAGSLPKNVETFRVIGFEKLVILPSIFADYNLTIKSITFKDIHELILHPGSLYFHQNSKGNTKVEVKFEGCIIPKIPEGAITQNVTRQDSKAIELGLEDTRYLNLEFESCNIGAMERNAIANTRFISFSISNSKIDLVETRGINIDVGEKFAIINTKVSKITRNSICINSDGVVLFEHNVLNRVEGFAFNITSDSKVLFESNQVEELEASAFMGIMPPKDVLGASIVFLKNTVEKAAPASLMINQRYKVHERKLFNNSFDVPCSCNISEVFSDFLNTSNFEGIILTTIMANSLCMNGRPEFYVKVKDFMEDECSIYRKFYIITVGLVLAIILILTIIIVICWQRVKKLKEENSYAAEGSTRSFSTLRSCPPLSPGLQGPSSTGGRTSPSWIMAIPEIKTYQEAEFSMPYDHTETMDSSKLSYKRSPCNSYRSN